MNNINGSRWMRRSMAVAAIFLWGVFSSFSAPDPGKAGRRDLNLRTADANTVLLDHFDNSTSATLYAFVENGAACGSPRPSATPVSSYGSGPYGLNQALLLSPPAGQPAGSASYLQYPGGQLLSQPNGTIEFWIRMAAYGTNGASLVDQGQYYNACSGWTFQIRVDPVGKLYASAWDAFSMDSGTTVMPLNVWTHLAVTWGSSGAKFYVNGIQVGSDANTGMPASGYGGSVMMMLATGAGATSGIDELQISNVQRTWTDATPDPFSFTDQTNVALNTVVTSNAITVAGINKATPISIVGGTYAVNGGSYTSAAGNVINGDTVSVRQTSSGSYSATTNATLTVGGVADTFSVTTIADIPAPTVTVTSPNGGESWAWGSSHNIAWTSTGTIANVKIEYSTNNGTGWTTISASTANTGSYAWTVPYTSSTQCLVRVSDASNAAIFDVSNAVFKFMSDSTEPNDDSASAATLPMGTTENLIYTDADIDWYKFFVPPADAGKDLKVNVRITSPYPDPPPANWGSDIDFELLDGALGVRGVVFSGSDNETLYLPNVTSGWYYIYIAYATINYADSSTYGRYSISLEAGTNFGLGYISGRVVDGVGQGIEKVFLTLTHFPDDWTTSFPAMTTGAGGNFTVAFLPGTYDLNFSGKAGGRVDSCDNQAPINVVAEYYNNKKSLSQADHVGLVAGQTQNLGDVALDVGAIVSGHVTDGTGNPLANMWVSSADTQGYSAGNLILTNATGDYSLNGVPIGGAKISFSRSPFASGYYAFEYYNDKPTFGTGDLLATQANVTIPNINAQLTNGGMISGTVKDGLGNGLIINVRLFSVLDGTFARAGVSSATGTGIFNLYNVKPGDYKIFFNAAGTAYASEWYNDTASFAQASVITVTEGNETSGINAQLAAPEINLKQGATDIASGGTYGFGSKVIGTDTDTVFTIQNVGTDPLALTGLPLTIGGANADQFSVTVQPTSPVAPAGSQNFTVRFHPTSAGEKTAQVSIASNDGNENPYLLNLTGTGTAPAGSLTVTSPNGGETWAGGSTHNITWTTTGTVGSVKIEYSANNGSSWTTIVASTPNDGSHPWTLPSSPSSQSLVRVSDAAISVINDVSNAVFTIIGDGTEPNDDAASAAVLSMGTTANLIFTEEDIDWYKFFVPPADAGKDLKVNVRVTSPYPDPAPANWRSDIDFELLDGALAVRGVVIGGSDNETLYIANAASGWYYIYVGYCTTEYADSSTYARYSVSLETGTAFGLGYLTGRVVDGAGQGIEKAFLTLYHYPNDWNTSFPAMTTGPGGNYKIAYLPGTYDLNFTGKVDGRETGCANQAPINVVAEFYNDKKSQSLADHLSLVAGQTQNLGDAALDTGAIVSGHVTDAGGNPLANIWVGSYDAQGYSAGNTAQTNGSGDYLLHGVPIGGAKIRFWDNPALHASEYYNDKPSFGSGNLLATQAGVTIPNINAQLTSGGSVSGAVSNGQGSGVIVNVRLYSVLDGTFARAGVSSATGTGIFNFYNVKPGDYKVFFNGAGTAYASEWYSDAASFALATVITVAEGSATTGINAQLAAPEINLKQGLVDIATGGTYGFGTKVIGTDTDTVFTIENTGADALTLTGLPLTIGGTNADQFLVTVQPVSPVAPAGSRSFTIRFHPTSAGAKTAQISIASNDSDENPYILNLTGTGDAVATILAVTSPNGGESWAVGSSHAITWTSTGSITNVKIEYSTNNGTAWTTVIASTPNDGSHPWTIPNNPSVQCLVRVSDASNILIYDVSNAVFTIRTQVRKDDLLGTWAGQGVYFRNSDTGGWTVLATPATKIVAGDLDGDGIDDLIGIWPSQGGVWAKYSASGAWAQLSSTADWIAAADMNGDARAELLGSWTGQGVYWRNNTTGVWTQMATPATKITAGDLDGDGTDDLIGIWPSQGGVWVKYSQSGAWALLSSTADWIATGDMNGDGRDDLLGAWTGQGVYYRNSMTGQWVLMATPATMITSGDLDGDGKGDLIGIWPSQGGVWVKYSQSGSWTYLSSSADWIATGKMRAANGLGSGTGPSLAQGLGADQELELPMGGLAIGPLRTAGFLDLSANSPGRDGFTPLIDKNLRPEEKKATMSFPMRIPGPGEPGFRFFQQKNIFPVTNLPEENIRKNPGFVSH